MIPELLEQDFDVVVVDEAHHAVMPTYQELLTALGFLSPPAGRGSAQSSRNSDHSAGSQSSGGSSSQSTITPSSSSNSVDEGADSDDSMSTSMSRGPQNPNKLLVGFTATPYRRRDEDSKLLLEMLCLVFHRDIKTMVKEGYLSPVSAQLLSLGVKFPAIVFLLSPQ